MWGYDDSDVIPRKAFLVAQKIGGQVIGAFDTRLPGAPPEGSPESMIGFAMSLPGVKTGNGEPTILFAFPHAGGARMRTEMEVLARNSSWNNDVRRFPGIFD